MKPSKAPFTPSDIDGLAVAPIAFIMVVNAIWAAVGMLSLVLIGLNAIFFPIPVDGETIWLVVRYSFVAVLLPGSVAATCYVAFRWIMTGSLPKFRREVADR